jgi:hypothetical protein
MEMTQHNSALGSNIQGDEAEVSRGHSSQTLTVMGDTG